MAGLLDHINISRRQWQANNSNTIDLDAWVREGLASVLMQESTCRLGCAETCFDLSSDRVKSTATVKTRTDSRHDGTAAVKAQ